MSGSPSADHGILGRLRRWLFGRSTLDVLLDLVDRHEAQMLTLQREHETAQAGLVQHVVSIAHEQSLATTKHAEILTGLLDTFTWKGEASQPESRQIYPAHEVLQELDEMRKLGEALADEYRDLLTGERKDA